MTKTTEAVIGRWPEILDHYGFKITGNRHIDCPMCNKKKFRIDNKNDRGTWICNCGSGDGWELLKLTTGRSFSDLAKEIDVLIGNYYVKEVVPRRDYEGELRRYWQSLKPIKGSIVEEYLNNRGIYRMPKRAVKFSNNEFIFGAPQKAMFAVATNEALNPIIKHRTFLDGGKKADVPLNKITDSITPDREELGSVAVKLFDSDTCLGVAEGIETALAAHQLYDLPTWSTMNTSFLKRFLAPIGVEHLKIFADTDPRSASGHEAAFICAKKNLLSKNSVSRVTVLWPENGDFNDVLLKNQDVSSLRFER